MASRAPRVAPPALAGAAGTRARWTPVEVGVAAIFLAAIFGGAARKWLVPETVPALGYAVYLSKFAFLLALGVLATRQSPAGASRSFTVALAGGIALIAGGGLLSAVSGLRPIGAALTFLFIVGCPWAAWLASSRLAAVDLSRLLRLLAIAALVPAALGLVQFQLPAEHVLNTYLAGSSAEDVSVSFGRVRATGTFSYITGMSAMALTAAWIGLMLRTCAEGRLDEWLGLAAIAAGLVCGLVSQSRSGVLLASALLLGSFLLGSRDRRTLAFLAVGLAWLAYSGLTASPDPVAEEQVELTEGVFQRFARADSFRDRIGSEFEQLGSALEWAPGGAGLGGGQIAAGVLATGRYGTMRMPEAELARLVAEVGVLGLLGVLVVRVGLVAVLFACWLRAPPGARRNALLVTALAVTLFLVRNSAFNHVAAALVWTIAALGLALANHVPPRRTRASPP